MNREYVFLNEEEREIDLADMFFYLLGKWRILIIAVMVGILVGFCFYLLKSRHEEPVSGNVISEEYETTPETLSCMEQALYYRIMYFQQSVYHQESYIMQMNPKAVYTGVVEYYLSAGDYTNLISERCQNIINDQELLAELQEILGVKKDMQYLQELLGCSTTVNNTVSVAENVSPYSVVTYTVFFVDENVCAAMLEALQEKVEEEMEGYQEKYGLYDYEAISKFVEIRRIDNFASAQKTDVDSLNTYISGYTKLENELSSEDRAYYDAVYLPNGLKEAIKNGLTETDELKALLEIQEVQEIEEVQSQRSVKMMVKWILLGIILMIVIVSGSCVLKYLFNRNVKSARELQNVYGLRLLGNVVLSEEKKNVIDRWIGRMAEKCQIPADAPEYVSHMIALMGLKNIIACGSVHDVKVQQIFQGMVFEDFIHQSQSALQKAKESDGIILMVEKGKTCYQEVRRELEICDLHGVTVLGAIVID